jgi:hypothetical protein
MLCDAQVSFYSRLNATHAVALGNQINSFYRHGHGDNCKRYINNFYWCMTNAWMTEDKKKVNIFVLKYSADL